MTTLATDCDRLAEGIAGHLDTLCNRTDNRHLGSPGNRAATAYVRDALETFGLDVEYPEFPCLDWEAGEASMRVGDLVVPAEPSPYSLPFDGEARLETASTIGELAAKEIEGSILLLHGDLCQEQLFPKGFVFYNPVEHQQIIAALETRPPAAIVTATGICPGMAGALYPFPLFEDGDFDIPSVFTKDVHGLDLIDHVGEIARLSFLARRIPSTGHNVIATRRRSAPALDRVVLTAHVDAKRGTPGALDNAAGVATMLAVAELLQAHPEGLRRDNAGETAEVRAAAPTVEIAILNGEDDYAVAGQMAYLHDNRDRFSEMRLVINVDGAGDPGGLTAYSFYEYPADQRRRCVEIFDRFLGLVEGAPWPQGDHSMFVQQGVPAIAFTSSRMGELWTEVAHTERDRVEGVDPHRLAELARAIAAVAEASRSATAGTASPDS